MEIQPQHLQITFNAVGDRLIEDGTVPTERGRMLRAEGLRTGGRFFAFPAGGDLVIKLGEARVNELIASGVGRPCQLGRARPMREWVRVVPAGEEAFTSYLVEARDFVTGGRREPRRAR